jgi:hypothetical protein
LHDHDHDHGPDDKKCSSHGHEHGASCGTGGGGCCGHSHGHGHTHEEECPIPHAHTARPSALWIELREHMPFSVSAVAMGLIAAGVICVIGFAQLREPEGAAGPAAAAVAPDDHAGDDHAGHDHAADDHAGHDHPPLPAAGDGHDHGHDHAHDSRDPGILFFHLFHPAHMLFSATATTAMFRRYDRKVGKAVIVGLLGAIGVCGVSDILMPQVSLMILGISAPMHICLIEHPGLVLPFAFIGVLVGVAATGGVMRSTVFTHSLHVLASTMASIFYMVGPMGMVAWIGQIGVVFLFVVVAVMLPCCFSDIIFPLLLTRRGHEEFLHTPHHH